MQILSIIPTIVTFIGVFSFAVLFTILYQTYATSQMEEIKSGKRDIEIIDEVIHNRQEKVIRRRKIVKIFKNIFYYLALAIVVPIFLFSLYSKIMNNVLMIGGKTLMVVASPSMSVVHDANKKVIKDNNLTDQFDQHDIIYLEKIDDPSELDDEGDRRSYRENHQIYDYSTSIEVTRRQLIEKGLDPELLNWQSLERTQAKEITSTEIAEAEKEEMGITKREMSAVKRLLNMIKDKFRGREWENTKKD